MTWHYELKLTDDFTGSVESKLFSLSNNHDVPSTEALCHGRRRPCFDIEALVVETLQHSGWRVWCIRATCYRHSLMTILFDFFLLFDSWFHFGFASPVKRYFNIEDIFKNLMDVHFAGPVDWFESQRMISCVFSKDIQSGSNRRSRWWLQCVDIWSSDKKRKNGSCKAKKGKQLANVKYDWIFCSGSVVSSQQWQISCSYCLNAQKMWQHELGWDRHAQSPLDCNFVLQAFEHRSP